MIIFAIFMPFVFIALAYFFWVILFFDTTYRDNIIDEVFHKIIAILFNKDIILEIRYYSTIYKNDSDGYFTVENIYPMLTATSEIHAVVKAKDISYEKLSLKLIELKEKAKNKALKEAKNDFSIKTGINDTVPTDFYDSEKYFINKNVYVTFIIAN